MAFTTTTTTTCTDCGAKFQDQSYKTHDCRTAEQIAEDQAWHESFEADNKHWDKFSDKHKIRNADFAIEKRRSYERAVEGKCVLVHRDFNSDGRPYVSPVLNNPSWGTVFKHFSKAVDTTKDYHHSFLEGLFPYSGTAYVNKQLPEGCEVFLFSTGS